jgi:ribosome-associated heat shock protein Hsp15
MSRRIDLWLWYARFAKTRSLAARLCDAGAVTVNGETADKARMLRAGDTVSVPQGRVRRTLAVRALGERRGPAAEARLLYEETRPPEPLAKATAWEPLLEE